MKKILSTLSIVGLSLFASQAFAISISDLEGNIGTTTNSRAVILTYVIWFVAAVFLAIMGFNIYKKSKNPNGNEGSIILGSFLAAVALLGISEMAGLGTSAIFDSEETGANNIRVGKAKN